MVTSASTTSPRLKSNTGTLRLTMIGLPSVARPGATSRQDIGRRQIKIVERRPGQPGVPIAQHAEIGKDPAPRPEG